MLKSFLQSLAGLAGYKLVRKGGAGRGFAAPLPPTVPAPDDAAVRAAAAAKEELERVRAERDHSRAERDGYKLAYEAVSTELSNTQVVLKRALPDGINIVKEASVKDPEPTRRLKDTPELIPVIKEEIEKHKLPDEFARILLDPEFSVEDRIRYRQLPQTCSCAYWEGISSVIAKIVNGQYGPYQPRHPDQAEVKGIVDQLQGQGLVRLPRLLSDKQVAEMQDHFFKHPVFNGHIPTTARHRNLRRYVNYTAEDFALGSYSIGDIAMAPHLLELALSPLLTDAAAMYFGCTPQLTWLQSWWNFTGGARYDHGQNFFHRDSTDFRMFWLYIYLSDVEEGCGQHQIIRRSGNIDFVRESFARAKADPATAAKLGDLTLDDLFGLGHSIPDDVKQTVFPDLTETLLGPAGTMFISRGIDYHRVCTPVTKHRRQIIAMRFCINDFVCPSPDRDGDLMPGEIVADRIGSDPQTRYMTKMRFDWSKWGKN
jgi:hypothetical protein